MITMMRQRDETFHPDFTFLCYHIDDAARYVKEQSIVCSEEQHNWFIGIQQRLETYVVIVDFKVQHA